jgi:hypothetical protein
MATNSNLTPLRASASMILALSAMVWSIAIGGHELIGHGGVCAIDPGCDWVAADAMYFDGTRKAGPWLDLQRAAGSGFNILLAIIAALWLWRWSPRQMWLQVTLWLTVVVNLFDSASYIAFGWLIHPGMDWARLATTIEPVWAGRTTVMSLGGTCLILGLYLGRKLWPAALGDIRTRRSGLRTVGLVYLACGIVAVVASLQVPHPDRMMMLSGGIGGSFGFMFWLLPLGLMAPRSTSRPVLLKTHGAVLAAACSVSALYVFGLGPGIQFAF